MRRRAGKSSHSGPRSDKSGVNFHIARTYLGIISGNLFRFPQGSAAEISGNGRHMPVGATGEPHLRFEFLPYSVIFFAILAH
jgi:hypothetical protein